jgi:hypothetical protein
MIDNSNPVTMLGLRCKACSAPLPANATGDIIRCEYCGSSQKLVDARAFYDQILGQVNAWVRQAMPAGIGANVSGITDPVARHMVFMNNIRPRLTTEYGEYKFNALNLLSHPLIALPYMTEIGLPISYDPKNVFLFQAKVQSVQPLAVDDESKDLVKETSGLSIAYGYLLNNVSLMRDLRPERYFFMTQNLDAATEAIKDVEKFVPIKERLLALAKLCKALDLISSLKAGESTAHLKEAEEHLAKAEASASQNLEMGIMVQAMRMERSAILSTSYLAQAQIMKSSGNVAEEMYPIVNLLGLLNNLKMNSPPKWQARFIEMSHHEQILKAVADIRAAQSGGGGIRIATGSGNILAPFWAVDIPYTFQTGALWKTQGVEVAESMLISATFPVDQGAASGMDPRAVLTDVFSARERKGFFNDGVNRMFGNEKSISGGGVIREIIRNAQPASPSGRKVIPPLSTPQDAIILAQDYIARSIQVDRTIQNQLRLSAPRCTELVFVPAQPDSMRPNVLPWLGILAPSSIGNLGVLSSVLM